MKRTFGFISTSPHIKHMPSFRSQRGSLAVGLDKEIGSVVRKLADDLAEEDARKRLTISMVYESIKNSNSALKRRNKKQLEDSIDRVLMVMREEEDSDDSIEGDFDGIDDPVPELKPTNFINKTITKTWATSQVASPRKGSLPSSGTGTPTVTIPPVIVKAQMPAAIDRQANGEPLPKRKRVKEVEVDHSPPKDISLSDLGGVDSVIKELTELVAMPMMYSEIYTKTGIQPPRGVLLHGPPGCGKTMIAHAFAAEIGVAWMSVSAPSLVAGMSGESEKKIRDVFEEAKKQAPCLVFIDEIDVIMGKRESAQREMEKRIVAQMLTCMDDMALEKTGGKPVIIIAATNRPDSLDPALRRAGRFNKEINLGVPNEIAREKILRALTRKLILPEEFDYQTLAKMTPGFVGADLNDIVSVAGTEAMKRMMADLRQRSEEELLVDEAMDLDDEEEDLSHPLRILRNLVKRKGENVPEGDYSITYDDFLTAIPKVQPSAKREGFATIPDTTWAHIGALHAVREQLTMAIIEPIKNPQSFARVGITAPTGVLLWGPPGCGKTLLAKAVANESKANFISIKGPELLNKYVGESERAVRQVFERARSSIPCILFFDELDALVPKREDSLSEASSKVVNTLLTELDGLSSRAGIYVVAATNRPDMIDPAMLRPGRLGTSILIKLPEPEERVEILKALYRKVLPNDSRLMDADLEAVARDERCKDFSGADLGQLHQAAAVAALKRDGGNREVRIEMVDWEVALGSVRPSVKDVSKYRRLEARGM